MKLNFCRVMRGLVRRFGDAVALVNVERGRRLSYREYHLRTNRIANALRDELDIGHGDRFMLILENDNLSLLHMPMFLKQEGTAVLTNLRDSLEEHRRRVEFGKPKLVILENRLPVVNMIDSAGAYLPVLVVITLVGFVGTSAAARFVELLKYDEKRSD